MWSERFFKKVTLSWPTCGRLSWPVLWSTFGRTGCLVWFDLIDLLIFCRHYSLKCVWILSKMLLTRHTRLARGLSARRLNVEAVANAPSSTVWLVAQFVRPGSRTFVKRVLFLLIRVFDVGVIRRPTGQQRRHSTAVRRLPTSTSDYIVSRKNSRPLSFFVIVVSRKLLYK